MESPFILIGTDVTISGGRGRSRTSSIIEQGKLRHTPKIAICAKIRLAGCQKEGPIKELMELRKRTDRQQARGQQKMSNPGHFYHLSEILMN